jgi:methylenetetrahydrofolate dehydrogenase (NADP+) / methenyltetrahydrofolate cyclohydrolase
MSGATIIDGKAMAAGLRAEVAAAVARLSREHGVTPGLAVVLVGDNPASEVYVRNKDRQTRAAGMASFEVKVAATATESELLAIVDALNKRADVDGILVQLPLPAHISPGRVIEAIDPAKDVDGFHPINVGRLASGQPALVPCTPLGCIMLAKSVQGDLTGLDAVIVGRSNIVGKPVAQLLLAENCTITIAHSRSRALPTIAQRADLLIAAVGRPEFIRGDWIKPGAIVIDVGINRVPAESGKSRLVGDVHFEGARKVAGAITPVPGGVGPMTIACLLRNTLAAAAARRGIKIEV